MPPMAFVILPFACSALPSASSLESPRTFPAVSFTVPLACSANPLIRSLSMNVSSVLLPTLCGYRIVWAWGELSCFAPMAAALLLALEIETPLHVFGDCLLVGEGHRVSDVCPQDRGKSGSLIRKRCAH